MRTPGVLIMIPCTDHVPGVSILPQDVHECSEICEVSSILERFYSNAVFFFNLAFFGKQIYIMLLVNTTLLFFYSLSLRQKIPFSLIDLSIT